MNPEQVDLVALYIDLSESTDERAEKEGKRIYHEEFITRKGKSGIVVTHDGEEVIFFADRFHHAFHTSHNRARHAYSKAKIAVDRIERVRWIKPIIEGRVSGIECWEVPLKVPEEGVRRLPGKRLYVSWRRRYVIWLEPLRNGGFKFSTAYPPPRKEIERYTKRARKIWSSDIGPYT